MKYPKHSPVEKAGSHRGQRLVVAVTVAVGAAISVLSINTSRLTPGAHGDSVAYMSAAESFVQDGTFRTPVSSWATPDSTAALSHFPPGFSVAIAVPIKLFGIRAEVSALWVMALGAGIALGMAYWITSTYAGASAGYLSALLLILTPAWTKLHLAIWSESVYLAILLIMLYVMLKAPKRPLLYGTLAALGVAVRYVGIAGTVVAAIWAARQGRTFRERMVSAAWASAPSTIFLLAWGSYVASNRESVRQVSFYGGLFTGLKEIGWMFVEWLVPNGVSGLVGGPAAAALVLSGMAGLVVMAVKSRFWLDGERSKLVWVVRTYAAIYVVVVVTSRLFLDPRIPFDSRIFMPVLVLSTMFLAMSVKPALGGLGWAPRTVLAFAIGLWCMLAFSDIRAGVAVVNENGRYYTFKSWISDPVIRWVDGRSEPYDVIYSNEPELIYYHTARHGKQLPDVGEDLDAFKAAFEKRPGVIIVIYPLHIGDYTEKVWTDQLDIEPVVRSGAGVVYVPREAG